MKRVCVRHDEAFLIRAVDLEGSRTFCSAPWTHLHVAGDSSISACCDYDGSFGTVSKDQLAEVWRGAKIAKLRQRLLAGKEHPGCKRCYQAEKSGIYSHRQRMNHDFATEAIERVKSSSKLREIQLPISLDLRFSNLCNMRCRMCFHGSSSRWFSEAKSLGESVGKVGLIRSFESFCAIKGQLDPLLKGLRHIYFAGGEPLVTAEHYSLVEYLLRRGRTDIRLSYNSNLSQLSLDGKSVLELWNAFPSVDLEASIDGTGEIGELIRKDLRWAEFKNNIKLIQQRCPHVRLNYGTTVLMLNVFHLPDLLKGAMEELGAGTDSWRVYPLVWPPYYSVRALPAEIKADVTLRLQAAARILRGQSNNSGQETLFPGRPPVDGQIDTLSRFMNEEDWSYLLPQFLERTRKLDALRGEDTYSIVSELAGLQRHRPVV